MGPMHVHVRAEVRVSVLLSLPVPLPVRAIMHVRVCVRVRTHWCVGRCARKYGRASVCADKAMSTIAEYSDRGDGEPPDIERY